MKKVVFAMLCAVMCMACSKQPVQVMENQVINNMLTRASVRQFTGEPITAQQLDTLLHAAMSAPTAMNKQPWAFIVVTDAQVLEQIGEQLPYSRCGNRPSCAIVPCGDLTKALEGEGQDFWIHDVSAATENILLAAHSLGLGAVWTGVYPSAERVVKVQTILGLPEYIVPLCIVPVGYAAEQPAVKNKFDEANIHYNMW